MAYTPTYTRWQNNEIGATPITAEALNNMEDGIKAAHTGMESANTFVVAMKQAGVGASNLNLWDSTVNLLTIPGTRNGGVALVNDLPANLQNCPISGDNTFVAYRRQGVYSASQPDYAFVELIEIAPTPGRHWVNLYNRSGVGWLGWRRIDNLDQTPQTGNAQLNGLSLVWRYVPAAHTLGVTIMGQVNEALAVSAGYWELATLPALAAIVSSAIIKYTDYNNYYKGQLRIDASGKVQLGYARNCGDNTATDIPAGQSIYINEVFVA